MSREKMSIERNVEFWMKKNINHEAHEEHEELVNIQFLLIGFAVQ